MRCKALLHSCISAKFNCIDKIDNRYNYIGIFYIKYVYGIIAFNMNSVITKIKSATHWPRSHQRFLAGIIPVVFVVILYELIYLFIPDSNPIIQSTLGFALIVAVVIAAIRQGMWPSMLAATFGILYLMYALSSPHRGLVAPAQLLAGSWLLFLVYYVPGMIIGYLRDKVDYLIMREKLARQRAEAGERKLAQILEQMPVGVVIADAPSGKITLTNQQLDTFIGHKAQQYSDYSEYPGAKLVDKEGKPLKQEQWPIFRVIEKQEQIVNEEYLFAQDGTISTFQVKGAPIYGDDQKIESGLVIIDDITSEKELEKRKDEFISVISHELKTPITSLKIYTQFLSKRYQNFRSNDLTHSLQKINEQADKLQRLVDSMLYIAQTQTDKLSYHFEIADLALALQSTIDEARLISTNHNFILECQPNVCAEIDPDRFGQVIFNLITNATKYSPPGTDIIIKLSSSNRKAKISVQDFGIGISPKDARNIFNRFYQSTKSNPHSQGGLGIGLYLAADIIKQHHGEIKVDSSNGKGSTFTITLPLKTKNQRKSSSQPPASTMDAS